MADPHELSEEKKRDYGYGVPNWSPYYKMEGEYDPEAERLKSSKFLAYDKLIPPQYVPLEEHERTDGLRRLYGKSVKCALGWDYESSADGRRLKEIGQGLPTWSPLYRGALDKSKKQPSAAAAEEEVAESAAAAADSKKILLAVASAPSIGGGEDSSGRGSGQKGQQQRQQQKPQQVESQSQSDQEHGPTKSKEASDKQQQGAMLTRKEFEKLKRKAARRARGGPAAARHLDRGFVAMTEKLKAERGEEERRREEKQARKLRAVMEQGERLKGSASMPSLPKQEQRQLKAPSSGTSANQREVSSSVVPCAQANMEEEEEQRQTTKSQSNMTAKERDYGYGFPAWSPFAYHNAALEEHLKKDTYRTCAQVIGDYGPTRQLAPITKYMDEERRIMASTKPF